MSKAVVRCVGALLLSTSVACRAGGTKQPASPSGQQSSEPQGVANEHAGPEFPGLAALADEEVLQADFVELDTPKFETADHVKVIREGKLPKVCADELAGAQWRQDILGAFDPDLHFDNCRFKQSLSYLQGRIAEATKAAAKNQRDDALWELGRALHGIQDFYSHTNFVELMAKTHDKLEDVKPLALWAPDAGKRLDALIAEGLTSGKVWWEPNDECPDDGFSHGDMAKDSDTTVRGKKVIEKWKMTHYRAARKLALLTTQEYLHTVLSRPAFAGIRKQCFAVGFTLTFDARQHGGPPGQGR
jgi:hypothetical protein